MTEAVPTRRRPRAELRTESHDNLEQRVAEIEARLGGAAQSTAAREMSDEALATVAQWIYQARRRRARHLPSELLGEPAWDILLDLFDAMVRGQQVRTTSASLASRVPATTALRWLTMLQTHGLVERYRERGDRRVRLIRLSQLGYQRMRAYLAEGIEAGYLPTRRLLG